MEIIIDNIDFELLRKQKRILLELADKIQNEESNSVFTQDDADTVEGMITLLDAIQDYAVDKLHMDKYDVYYLTLTFEESDSVCVVSDSHGQYVGKVFAEQYKDSLLKNGYDPFDLSILMAGPESELYLDVFSELFPRELKDEDGKSFTFFNDGESGNVWELPTNKYRAIVWED